MGRVPSDGCKAGLNLSDGVRNDTFLLLRHDRRSTGVVVGVAAVVVPSGANVRFEGLFRSQR